MNNNKPEPLVSQYRKKTPSRVFRKRPQRGGVSFPRLYSNNSTENETKATDQKINILSPYHKKQAMMIYSNAEKFIQQYGLKNVGFLTLTFPDRVLDNAEASRRFNSLKTHFLGKHFSCFLLIKEKTKKDVWHYHLLVHCKQDIRTGINFDEIYGRSSAGVRNVEKPNYKSANKYLRSIWKVLRDELHKFNFGRAELLPIESSAEAASRYVGKYVSKHIGARKEEDKGVRLFSCSRNFNRAANTNFAWNTDGSKEWRRKLKIFAEIAGIHSMDDMKQELGKHWAYHLATYIEQVDTLTPPEIIRIKKFYNEYYLSREAAPIITKDGYLMKPETGEILF